MIENMVVYRNNILKKELKQMEIQLYVLEQKVSLQVNRSLEDYYYEVTNELDSLRQSMSHLEK